MAVNTTSVLGDTIPTIIEEARFTEQFKEVIPIFLGELQKKSITVLP